MATAQHDRLWERILAALAARQALLTGNVTANQIAVITIPQNTPKIRSESKGGRMASSCVRGNRHLRTIIARPPTRFLAEKRPLSLCFNFMRHRRDSFRGVEHAFQGLGFGVCRDRPFSHRRSQYNQRCRPLGWLHLRSRLFCTRMDDADQNEEQYATGSPRRYFPERMREKTRGEHQ